MKRKHPRLANGMGSIKYLGKGRSNPYAVYAPEYHITDNGSMSYIRPICYVPDWYTGFAVLISYKAGTYKPGDEIDIARRMNETTEEEMSYVARKILADYRQIGRKEEARGNSGKHTLVSVYNEYMESRFGEYATGKFSISTQRQYQSSIKVWGPLYNRYVEDLRRQDIQAIVNSLSDSYAKNAVRNKIAVIHNVFRYAVKQEYISADPTASIEIPIKARNVEHHIPYTEDELKVLWEAASVNEDAKTVLIQIYSGFRASAFFSGFLVDKEKQTFTGGVKTGIRTIPIHPLILPFVMERDRPVPWNNLATAGNRTRKLCEDLGIRKHTTHSARHTFKMLCDRYGVNPIAQRILMGHSISGADIHDSVYSHFEIEDLRREINKIKGVL